MKKILVFALILISAMAMAAENYQFQVGGNPTLDLSNISGDVKLVAGNSGQIVINYTKKDDRFEVDIQQDGDRITVKVEVPQESRNIRGGVTFDIIFPAEGNLDITTVSGNVIARDISGDIRLKSVSGDVELENSSGDLRMETVSGNVEFKGISASARAEGTAISGNVTYTGMINDGHFEFSATSGDVILNYAPGSSFSISGRTVSGNITANEPDLKIKRQKYGPGASVSGSVNGSSAQVDANTVSGSVVVRPSN